MTDDGATHDRAPVRAADYRDIVRVSEPALSPGGEQVAFVRSVPDGDEEYESTVYVAPTDPTEGEPRRFTAVEGRDFEPRFSPAGDRIAFRSIRGDDERAQLWVLPTDGGEARRVTEVVGGVDSFEWCPDGERIAFTQRATAEEREAGHDRSWDAEAYERETPDPRVIDRMVYRAMGEYFDGRRSHVYVLDLGAETGAEAVERVTEGDRDFLAPTWRDGSTLYYAVKRGPEPDDSYEHDVDALDLDTRTRETVTTFVDHGPSIAVAADGRLAFAHRDPDRASMRQRELHLYDPEAGESRRLAPDLDRGLGNVVEPGVSWDDAEEAVHFLGPDEGHYRVRRVVPGADGEEDDVSVRVPEGTVSAFDVRDGVVFVRSEADHPGDLFSTTDAETRRLTRVNEAYLDSRRVGTPEEVRFESDGQEIQGWVLTPPGYDDGADEEGTAADPGAYPLVVAVHGGPHAMWTTAGTVWHEFRALAGAGYVVFWCNPRGSTGYGAAFAEAIERDWGAVTATDVLNGLEHVLGAFAVDPDETYLTGGSFGGFMTGWLVGHTDRFRAAAAQRGVYDLASFYGSTDAFELVEGDFDTTPWESPAFLWEQSPVAGVESVDTPTLVLHADEDYRVPVNNGEMFYLFLRKQGVDTRLVRYPREDHELSRSGEPRHVVDRLERIRRWFDGYSRYRDVPPALERGEDEGLELGGGE
jgi:dipeptidyl aminopeptidase/acylaminoacyl peptidase